MTWDINCDMGEAFGLYKMGDDEGIMPFITLANVACGFHAADPMVMRRTVQLAKRFGVKVGAHPSLPDREGFGRREMKLRPRGDRQRRDLPGRRAERLPRSRGHAAEPHQAARRALRHGGQGRRRGRRHRRRGRRLRRAPVRHERHRSTKPSIPEAACRSWANSTPISTMAPDGFLVITREHEAVEPGGRPRRVLRALARRQGHGARRPATCRYAPSPSACIPTRPAVAVAKAVFEVPQPAKAAD